MLGALSKVLAGCLVAAVAGGAETVQAEVSAMGGFKPAAAASGEKTNPYQIAGDETSECYAWAADGQCVANPAYMINSCKYSCWEWCASRFAPAMAGIPGSGRAASAHPHGAQVRLPEEEVSQRADRQGIRMLPLG